MVEVIFHSVCDLDRIIVNQNGVFLIYHPAAVCTLGADSDRVAGHNLERYEGKVGIRNISNTNLSLVPFEVMACNSVAVCSKGANSSWMVNEENSILVDYDPIQIADRMEYYFNHPDELATIRKKGMDFVKGTSWYKEAEKVYASMLKGIEEDEKKLQ